MIEHVDFTPEMRSTHTILVPNMLPIHFAMLEDILNHSGYKVELLKTTGRSIIDEGLKNVHNDTCYPALLAIGQLIDALRSGNYDLDHVALLLTQTGGGCRASNYISLLRKALVSCGMQQIPVISLNFSGLEKSSGFKITTPLLVKALYGLNYGDLLMWLKNQSKPYELTSGQTDALVNSWINKLCKWFQNGRFLFVKANYRAIIRDFAAIPKSKEEKIKVGIVGEIYMKYSPLGNNNLEEFLIAEGAEPVLTGVMDFCMYCMQNNVNDFKLYGLNEKLSKGSALALKYLKRWQKKLIAAIKKEGSFRVPTDFDTVMRHAQEFIGIGAKMGEGWLLTGEMVDFIKEGINNVVCTQPFGCLPNHIVAKSMMRKCKDRYPLSNIVAIDYDPSATAINQENRLKLMLSNARLTQQLYAKESN